MKKTIAIFVLLLSCLCSGGQVFSHLTVEDGLSNNTVGTICQDGDGRIWFGTHGGLSRFDGYDIDIFKYNPSDSHSVQSNFINYLYTDWHGNVWICSADGLSRYDIVTGRFDRIEFPELRSVEQVVQVSEDCYAIGTRKVSLIYNIRTGAVSKFMRDGRYMLFYSVFNDSGKYVFGTSSRELVAYSFDSDGVPHRESDFLELGTSSAVAVLPAGDGSYWLGTNGNGLLKADLDSGTVKNVPLQSLPSGRIENAVLDRQGRIWIVTKKGLCVHDPADGSDRVITHDIYDPSSLSSSVLRSSLIDSDGNLWLGSSYDGVSFLNSNQSAFNTIRSNPGPGALSDGIVKSLCVDRDNSVWIGTRSGGMNQYLPESGAVEVIPDVPHPLCIFCPEDRPGKVYAGTYNNGVYEIDKASRKAVRITRSRDINDIEPAHDGCLWIASLSGLYLCNPDRRELKKVKLGDELVRVIDLMTDSRGRLWVGSKERLFVYEVGPGNSLKDVTAPSLSDIIRPQFMSESSDGTVWIGTTDGLKYFRNGSLSDACSVYGVINQSIQGIETDSLGWMWISTYTGLLRFNPNTGELSTYYASDGLQSSAFTVHSSGRSSDGILYFGGPRGVSYFRPEDVRDNSTVHNPMITSLSVHNTPVLPGDGSGILSSDISHTSRIVFNHHQDAFTIGFSCPNYSSEGHDTFYYKLDGFDHDWILSRNREATYTNLSKGQYTFRVRVLNRNNIPSDGEAVLSIRVRPAWYETTVMEIFFILLLLGLIIYAGRILLKRIDMKNREAMEGMRQKYEEKLINAKLSAYCPPGARLGADEEKFLSSVIMNIESNFHDNGYSVETLASDMCMSRSNLHLKLKTITGLSPVELILKIRIEKACELIREGGSSLSDIAERTGFSSSSYFSTCFKKMTGKSPSDYK